jgi:hypothetical protein
MIKGVMIHEQMADYYDFLNLHGYKRCHEYHSKCEMKNLRHLHRYFINHFNRLIEEDPIENPDSIPSSWYRYTRQEVDTNTKRSAVKTGIEKWVAWETETKSLYQKMYTEAMNIGEVAAAKKIACYICGVDKELKWAQRKHLNLLSADYDIGYILGEQDHLHDWYKEKMHDKH